MLWDKAGDFKRLKVVGFYLILGNLDDHLGSVEFHEWSPLKILYCYSHLNSIISPNVCMATLTWKLAALKNR